MLGLETFHRCQCRDREPLGLELKVKPKDDTQEDEKGTNKHGSKYETLK